VLTALLVLLAAQSDPPVTVWAEGLRTPARMAVDEQGRVYVADREGVGRLDDADRDGRADRRLAFADGAEGEGRAGGLLVRRGEVWLARDPALLHLRDRDADGRAEAPKTWFAGFGLRPAHGLQGLVAGPDGKLYFAVGDGGFRVVSLEGERLEYPEMGAILRCDLDGSNLDVFAIGFRNPRDLAFDAAGNLWVVDAAAGQGDRSRWIEVIEGGDYGWRAGYETPPAADAPSLWISEALWKGTPGILPAAALLDGPTAAIAVEPVDRGRFLRADGSALHVMGLEEAEGGWTIVEQAVVLSDVRAVDVEPGVDGSLFVLDAGGRILKLPWAKDSGAVDGLAGLESCPLEELAARMGHGDLRVRLQAQQELVRRQGSTQILMATARSGPSTAARRHAVWGLGQLYTRKSLLPMLRDADPELRAQAARVLGDRRVGDAYEDLVKALKDEAPRVRRFAAVAVGKIARREGVRPLADMIRENDGRDPRLRHAGAFALALIGNVRDLEELKRDASAQVRLAAVLALRRLGRPEAAAFLGDADPAVAVEAARAIHDLPIPAALPALAERLAGPPAPEAFTRRAVNAAYITGRPDLLAAYAARTEGPTALRAEALNALGAWATPGPRDRVTGAPRAAGARDPGPAREALNARIDALRSDPAVASAAARAEAVLRSAR